MTNPLRGEAVLGDTTLVFDIDAICHLGDDQGAGLQALLVGMKSDMRVSTLVALVWAGMLNRTPAATRDDAKAVVSVTGLEAAMTAVSTALQAALPSAEGNGSEPSPTTTRKGRNGPGRRS